MNKNHFTFSLIHKQTKKYGDISDDVSDHIIKWAVLCAARDWLVRTRDWDQSWAVWSQSLVSAKDWSRKWSDPKYWATAHKDKQSTIRRLWSLNSLSPFTVRPISQIRPQIQLFILQRQSKSKLKSQKKNTQLEPTKLLLAGGEGEGKPWRCVSLDSRHQLALRGEEVRNLILGSLPLLV